MVKEKLTIEECIKKTIEKNPKTAFEVLKVTTELATKEHWHKNKIDRIRVFFKVCNELSIDSENLSR